MNLALFFNIIINFVNIFNFLIQFIFHAGYYLYIETSGFIPAGANAYLLSPQYQPASRTGGKCLQFWYHMYGSSIGSLNIYVKTGTAYPGRQMWTRSGNQGNQWLIGQVSITTSSGFNVSVVANSWPREATLHF